MTMRSARLLSMIGLAALSGCLVIKEPTPPPQNLVAFYDGHETEPPLRRVVILPFVNEDGSERMSMEFVGALTDAIGKRNVFQTVPVDHDAIDDTAIASLRLTGVYRTRDLITIGRRFGADAVLHGTITNFSGPPHLSISVQLALIDVRHGTLAYSTQASFDTTEQTVQDDIHNDYEKRHTDRESLVGWRETLLSPRLFLSYVGERLAETIGESLKEARATRVAESQPSNK